MDLKELFLEKQRGDFVLIVVFLVIGFGLAVAGFVLGDFLYYIRAGIFCVAAWFLRWRNNR